MTDFDIFTNRCTITASLELETPLRIGGGQNAAAYSISAAPVLQTYDAKRKVYEPYLPGSSLKGVLRSAVERIIRTFNETNCCVGVAGDSRERPLCGNVNCFPCTLFGSMKAGAKIRVRDAHLSTKSRELFGNIRDKPHCATQYKEIEGKFIVKTKPRRMGNKDIDAAVTSLRIEETVAPGLSFDVQIDIDNADEKEIGLVLLALDEFNRKRIHLGGGTSRGNGFADINLVMVKKKSIDDTLMIKESFIDPREPMKEAKKYLKSIDSGKDSGRRDFDVYYMAHSKENEAQGHIVALVSLTTLTDFMMPGVEEETVTSGGLPIIPGATMKGFFRHKLIEKGVDAGKIKQIFGFTERDSHRARLLFSDAYNIELDDPKMIPSGSVLKMWMIFDNMTAEEVGLIEEIRTSSKNVITGKTSSKWNPSTRSAIYNSVKMDIKRLDIFKTSNYLAEAL